MNMNTMLNRVLKRVEESTANFCLDCLGVTSSTDQARIRKHIESELSNNYLFEQGLCRGCLFRKDVIRRRETPSRATTTDTAMQQASMAQRVAPVPLTWTREKPARQGWYWYRDPMRQPMIVFVQLPANTVHVCASGNPPDSPLPGFSGEWYGPLESPP